MRTQFPIDEQDNEQLRGYVLDYSRREVRDEWNRCNKLVCEHSTTGDDLSYWFERIEILLDSEERRWSETPFETKVRS